MSKTFYTSDTHFNHVKILEYEKDVRPYANLEDMNRDLIARWNARVGPDDVVYHLGDFAMGQYVLADPLFRQLNGREKHLVMGNHDRTPTRMLSMGWTTAQKTLDFALPDGRQVHMCHYPKTYEDLGQLKVSLQLCGHVHSKWARARTVHNPLGDEHDNYVEGTPDVEGRVINVGVDVRDLEPKTLEELLSSPRVL